MIEVLINNISYRGTVLMNAQRIDDDSGIPMLE